MVASFRPVHKGRSAFLPAFAPGLCWRALCPKTSRGAFFYKHEAAFMDWKKLAEEAQQLEEKRQEEDAAPSLPQAQPKLGDAVIHPTYGRCVYAGVRGDGQIYLRDPNGKFLRLAPKLVQMTAVAGQARTFSLRVKG
jgi:hypothetical protein